MLGAIRICGRWIDEKILERLSQRSQGPTPPSQSKLVEDFCRQADWRDAKGRLSTSSARVGLLKLEKRGLVQLPAMTPRCKSAKPRGLVDDQELLPPLPTVPTDGHKLVGLKLRLIANDEDPQHWLWNRLIGLLPSGCSRTMSRFPSTGFGIGSLYGSTHWEAVHWWEPNCAIWWSMMGGQWAPWVLVPLPIISPVAMNGLAGRRLGRCRTATGSLVYRVF